MGSLRAFWAILDFEFHLLAFLERFVTLHLDGGIMREHIVAAVGRVMKPYPLVVLNHFTVPVVIASSRCHDLAGPLTALT